MTNKEEYKAKKKVGLGKVVDRTNLAITEKAYLAIESFLSQTIDELTEMIAAKAEQELLVKCECEDGECKNCARLCQFIDDLREAERMRDLSIKGKR